MNKKINSIITIPMLKTNQVITPQGFKNIEDLCIGDKILCADRNGHLSFKTVIDCSIQDCYTDIIEVSDQYKKFYVNAEANLLVSTLTGCESISIREAFDSRDSVSFIHAGVYSEGIIDMNPLLSRLLAATQADGSIHRQSAIRFGFKNKKKISDLTYLLDALHIEYTITYYHDVTRLYLKKGETTLSVINILGPSKEFGAWCMQLTPEIMPIFRDELLKWDGSVANDYYTSTGLNNILFAQIVSILSGSLAWINYDSKANKQNDNLTKEGFPCKICYKLYIKPYATTPIYKYKNALFHYKGKMMVITVEDRSGLVLVQNGIPIILTK